ncbi:unnamed protein product [Didymodactylos carnosus]|uniref:V(D)J recombination-activating protein 1 RNase H domain-containing protein n=1 Tax=Didymodactylos carnosus TaxID=1234261 RepID=A0A8S2EI81_9BILA|nr:unnamed protein product [Didymodactylos carnosus]CAF3982597.1 unnamed protein product [Didymodactylos carnosus]
MTKTQLDVDQTLALKSHLNLSRNDVDFLKSFQKEYVHIPNRNVIREHAHTLLPEIEECREKRGIMVESLKETTILTISRLFDQLTRMNKSLPLNLTYKYKTGHDGAGGQSVYKASDNPMSDPNIFSKMYVPLSLSDTNTQEILWKNETPNSAFFTRPLALIAEKESGDLIRFINESFEPQEKHLKENGLSFEHNGQKYKVSIVIEDSMKDMKVRTIESGLGGADCLMCFTRQSDWKNKEKIEDGSAFQITRTAEKTLKLYDEMVADSGEIKKTKNDYGTRAGLTTEPISSSDHHYITLTHQYINGTTWFLNIFYRVKANLLTWAIRGERNQEKLRKAKDSILTFIQEKTGLKLDQVDSSAGHTGTSTTGQQGRRFFSHELREKVIGSLPTKHQGQMNKLMQMYSVILRAVSSTQLINVIELKTLAQEFCLFVVNELSWVEYNLTVHNLIFHSAELVERNNGIGLGELSEEALESCNKDVRNYREFLARKTGHIPNLTDSQSKRERKTSSSHVMAGINEDEVLLVFARPRHVPNLASVLPNLISLSLDVVGVSFFAVESFLTQMPLIDDFTFYFMFDIHQQYTTHVSETYSDVWRWEKLLEKMRHFDIKIPVVHTAINQVQHDFQRDFWQKRHVTVNLDKKECGYTRRFSIQTPARDEKERARKLIFNSF